MKYLITENICFKNTGLLISLVNYWILTLYSPLLKTINSLLFVATIHFIIGSNYSFFISSWYVKMWLKKKKKKNFWPITSRIWRGCWTSMSNFSSMFRKRKKKWKYSDEQSFSWYLVRRIQKFGSDSLLKYVHSEFQTFH